MRSLLGGGYEAFLRCYSEPPVRGLRVNTLKLEKTSFLELCPWKTAQSPTLDEGLILLDDVPHIGSHPYHLAGLFYMQEPSAMSVIEEAEIKPGMRVLDLCAAPGGKSGGIAARLKGSGLLVSNEIAPSRAKQLARNLERLGVVNAAVTNAHPDAVAAALPRFFDRVIVDAPCSGEGMFRKDDTAIAEWSLEHVTSCAARQRAILESAEKCVAPGGKLIYSTCTFSTEENEGVTESFLACHPDFMLKSSHRLYPHTSAGEGHFVAVLERASVEGSADAPSNQRVQRARQNKLRQPTSLESEAAKAFFTSSLASYPCCSTLFVVGERLLYCPFEIPDALFSLPLLSLGVVVGEFSKSRLKPSHSFFMAAHGFEYARVFSFDPESPALARFLHGEAIPVDSEAGSGAFCPVAVATFPIGFGKISDGLIKNHIPKGLCRNF